MNAFTYHPSPDPHGSPRRRGPAPSSASAAARREEFVPLLTRMRELVDGLSAAADRKLTALRKADAATLHSCAADEKTLLSEVVHNQNARQAVVAELARERRIPDHALGTLSAISQHFNEPHASAIRSAALGLRKAAEELKRKNQLADAVARNLQENIRAVFAELAKSTQDPLGYGRAGRSEAVTTRQVMDAVG